ncbi:MAG: FAD-dependent oxidoreductase [Synechococcaceae cyanobacterium]|nr:FAD-dependent oxidoreductase [Synechococcaceae cyanobacterium]
MVIVGGGFAGLYTALALAEQRRHPPILLIEPAERFLFLPLLYELLSGELRRWEIAPRYEELLAGRGVAWLQDRVERIDLGTRTLVTHGGRRLPWGRLVLACGGEAESFGVPGVDRCAMGFRSLADVERLQALLARLRGERRPLQRLAVVGAGPTGVELACKLADLAGGSALVELIEQGERLLPHNRGFSREQAEQALRRRDVRLRTRTRVTAVEPDRIQLVSEAPGGGPSEERLPVQGVVWTAGLRFQPPLLAPEPSRDRLGRLLCHNDLRLRGHDHVFVVGDLAHVPGDDDEAPLPSTAQVAFQQAPVAAANLLHSFAGEPLQPFRFQDLGEMLSLGVGEASLSGLGLNLAGPAAFQLRRIAYLTRLPRRSLQLRVAAGWLADWNRAAGATP